MKKSLTPTNLPRNSSIRFSAARFFRSTFVINLALFWILSLAVAGFAQPKRAVLKVGVTKSSATKGTLLSISSEASLRQAQTWQDNEGFHVFVPNASVPDSSMPVKEMRARLVGQSVELILQTKSGTHVDLQRFDDHLNLSVDAELEMRSPNDEGADQTSTVANSATNQSQIPNDSSRDTAFDPAHPEKGAATKKSVNPASKNSQSSPEDASFLATVFSGTGLLIVSALGLFGVLVSRKMYSTESQQSQTSLLTLEEDGASDSAVLLPSMMENSESAPRLQRAADRVPLSFGSSAHGPYRISHEINCLIGGKHHRCEVLSSSDAGDRRAIEAALLQVLSSSKYDQGARARVRAALERYGFVARQCAALLRAPEAFERSSAARALGEIACPASLPFLLEALHDSDLIVRNQAVTSLGRLQMPAAVDALRDLAKRHPDLSQVISNALKLCTEGTGNIQEFVHAVSTFVEPKPEDDLPSGEEQVADALVLLNEDDVDRRLEAVKELGRLRVQRSVTALCDASRHDAEPSVRSMAIANLGGIDHESVLPAILIGMADSSREVRAAAARAMSRLRFDRADAYLRLLQTADQDLLEGVAEACFESGLVSQNIDRLLNRDRRQGYEVFTLFCLLTKAGRVASTVAVISKHAKKQVRDVAISLLARTGGPELFEEFRKLAAQDDLPEDVRRALLEALGEDDEKSDQENAAEEIVATALANPEASVEQDALESFPPDSRAKSTSSTEFEIALDDISG